MQDCDFKNFKLIRVNNYQMIQNRGIKYLMLIVGSLVIPFLVTMVIIMITGDRITGMKNFSIPSIILIHLIFSLTQLKGRILKKVIYGIFAAIISTGLIIIPMYFDIQLNIDMYGFWEVIIFFSLATIGTWECMYQIDKKINKNNLQQGI
ncbi:MAG: hypothetical protein CMO01_11415 [Thalassobius sp.]|nr:hypothetical protein [Thalassovita sp.]